ncbi:class D beta-lactamase [Fictibacillus phosphorivorans]|nr:class D beta-lactamase [Fictibacillus phosphorivorans]MCM3718983.1 class D beta-lactamase [Fictibacillus phosphorivorans]MCM3776605.1 class D beta-lactamase [Fictibacillus phosphorivorans]
MKMIRTALLLVISFMVVFSGTITSGADQQTKDLKIQDLFKGKEGTMVLKNVKTQQTYLYNKRRSMTRITPESTYKVPNALIGLQTSAVRDEYEVKRWDGIVREFETWNRDHSLASAMRESAIWFYQDMAKDIGEERMQDYVNRMEYGNQDISGGMDRFWLDSSLKISAVEQVDFMEKLVKEELPFEEKHQKTVKRIMIQDDQDDYVLHGKTGTRLSDFGLGWFVGFIKTKKDTWVFAVNINGSGTEAKTITVETLKRKKIIK